MNTNYTQNNTILQYNRPEVFLPNELMIYSTSSMKERTKSSSKEESSSSQSNKKRFKRLFKTPNGRKKDRMNYTLVLTDFPRLLFVSEDGSEGSLVKIEIEVLFRDLPRLEEVGKGLELDDDRDRNIRNLHPNQNPNQSYGKQNDRNGLDYFLFKEVDLISCKTFEVKTSNGKLFRFEDPSESAQRWKDEIVFAFENCTKNKK